MGQPVTQELRAWIVAQAEGGFASDVVLKAMLDAGWQEDVALEALESTLRDHLTRLPQGLKETTTRPAGPAIPELDLSGHPRQLHVGDRLVDVLMHLERPKLALLGNFLSDDECDALIAAAKPRMRRSLTVQTATGGEELNADRTSDGMFFRRGEGEVVARVEARIARLLNWPLENGEGLQILHYLPGAEYKPHYDYFDPKEPGTVNIIRRGGQRVATLVMYLNEPVRGGGTTFPDLSLEVAPKRGNAVYFGYEQPSPVTKTLHGGAPVLEGEKWVATKWLREREFV
jgi:prolyl 4-hydroxylase